MKKISLLLLILGLSFTSCQTKTSDNASEVTTDETTTETIDETHFKLSDLVDLDLSNNGINVVTKAPKNAQVIQDGNDIAVYGGKFFKLTFSIQDFANPFVEGEQYSDIAEKLEDIKILASDADMNPSFMEFVAEDENGFLKKSESGLSFIVGVASGDEAVMISDGMSYDNSPDKFTEYSDEDIMVMYEAAKATKVK